AKTSVAKEKESEIASLSEENKSLKQKLAEFMKNDKNLDGVPLKTAAAPVDVSPDEPVAIPVEAKDAAPSEAAVEPVVRERTPSPEEVEAYNRMSEAQRQEAEMMQTI